MMTLDIVERMDAFIGANGHAARGGHTRHAGQIMGTYRLLEEIEPRITNRSSEPCRLLDGKSLIGIRRDEAPLPFRLEHPAHGARSRAIRLRRSNADLD